MTGQELSLNKAGQLAGISHDALYYKPKPRFVAPKPENVALVREWCFTKPTYGYRRITAMLHRNNVRVNHKQVHRIMQLNNWLLLFHKRYRQRTGKTLPLPSGSDQY
ncbi:MAG: transposase [Candidatus Diapherotrites archaeon]|nr:transposase [Candidatus Diapherotrites archaeon]